MHLTLHSILLGAAAAATIPARQIWSASIDDPRPVLPVEPPATITGTPPPHQATVLASVPVDGDVSEAIPAQALEARHDTIEARDEPDLTGNRYVLCMHQCLTRYVIPPNPTLDRGARAECRRRCKAVSGPKIAGDDDDDDDDSTSLAISTAQAEGPSLDPVGVLLCIRKCLGTKDPGVTPASDEREMPAIAACRRQCSSETSRPEIAGDDDDDDESSLAISAQDEGAGPEPNAVCMHVCLETEHAFDTPEHQKLANSICRRRCAGPEITGDEDDDDESLAISAQAEAEGASSDPTEYCMHICLDMEPAWSSPENKKVAAAECRRQCSAPETAGDDVPWFPPTAPIQARGDDVPWFPPTAPIQARDAIPEAKDDPGLLKTCHASCDREAKKDVEKCKKWCAAAWGPKSVSPEPRMDGLLRKCYWACSQGPVEQRLECPRWCRAAWAPRWTPPGVAGDDSSSSSSSSHTISLAARDPSPQFKTSDPIYKCIQSCRRGELVHRDPCEKWCWAQWAPRHTPPGVAGDDSSSPSSSHTISIRDEDDDGPGAISAPPQIQCYLSCLRTPQDAADKFTCVRRCCEGATTPGIISSATIASSPNQARDTPVEFPGIDPAMDPVLRCKYTQCLFKNTLQNLNETQECLHRCAVTHSRRNEIIASSLNQEQNPPIDLPGIDPAMDPVLKCKYSQCLFNNSLQNLNETQECLRSCAAAYGKGNETLATTSSTQARHAVVVPQIPTPVDDGTHADEDLVHGADLKCDFQCLHDPGNKSWDEVKACQRQCRWVLPNNNRTWILPGVPPGGHAGPRREQTPGKLTPIIWSPEICMQDCQRFAWPATDEAARILKATCTSRCYGPNPPIQAPGHPIDFPPREAIPVYSGTAAAAAVEKRDCGSDCISNTTSKPALTACWKECQEKGELVFNDPMTTTTQQQQQEQTRAPVLARRGALPRTGAESRLLMLGKREPKCTSKCLRGPPKTPKERHDCIRHCVRRSLD